MHFLFMLNKMLGEAHSLIDKCQENGIRKRKRIILFGVFPEGSYFCAHKT